MRKSPLLASHVGFALIILFFITSCRNQAVEIPFPFSDSAYPQPVTKPLQLGKPKKLVWTTVKSGSLNPEIKKLDLDALPAEPFDLTGFKPIPRQPEEMKFDFNSLPSKPFDFSKIASLPLNLRKMVLAGPAISKAARITLKAGSPLSIADIGLAQGMPDKAILTVMKDHKGLMWIATDKGLYRYDGETMLSFPNFSVGVIDMVEDHSGRIWFVNNQMFGVINLAEGTYSVMPELHTVNPLVPRMIVDEKGLIWLSRIPACPVAVIDPELLTYKKIDVKDGLSSGNVWGILQDQKKNIWIATVKGANIISRETNKISYLAKENGIENDTLRAITGDKKGRVWIAYQHGGVIELDPDKKVLRNYGQDQGFNHTVTYNLMADEKNRIWMATNHGASIIDADNGLVKFFYESDGVTEDFIMDFVMDDNLRVWAGTLRSGLSVIDQGGEMLRPLGTKSMSTLMEDGEGRIWAGAGNQTDGIQILDRAKKQSRFLTKRNGLSDNFIQNLMMMNSELWITTDGGFDRIYPAQKKLEHYGKAQGLSSDSLYGCFRDQNGNAWIASQTGGVDLIDFANRKIMHAGANEGLSDDNILDVRPDSVGNIWIATYTKGVDILNIKDGTIQNLFEGGPGLKDTCYRLLMLDPDGRMWIGTDKGIYVADKKAGTLTIISAREGISDDYITSILPYQGKMVVATHNKGNIIYPRKPKGKEGRREFSDSSWRIAMLEGSEGLGINVNNWNTNTITRKGEYIWGDAGIFILSSIRDQNTTAPTYVSGISMMNEPQFFALPLALTEKDTLWTADSFYVKGQKPKKAGFILRNGMTWDSVSGPYNLPVNLVLSHDPGNMQFHFSQAHLGRQDATLFSYMLLGVDNQWSLPSSKTSTENYLNPSPGKYAFLVRSMDISGHWGKPARLDFTIMPPWWKTWWMYIIYALALIGAIFGYNKYRSAALIKENRILEERVQARTQEVKQQADELKTINQISQALVGQADLKDLIDLVGNQLRDLFKANIVYIALLDKKTKMISFPYQYGDNLKPIKLGEGLTSKIILTGEPLLINKDVDEQASGMGVTRVGVPAASYLGVPIPVSNEIIGVLSIQSTEMENRFAEKDKNLLTTIAANVGVAIRKARLYEEVKLANTEADAARKNAEEANAAKSAFLSTVSHELRTPLTSVLGFARITKKRLEEKIFPVTDKSDPKTVKTIEQISGNLNVVIAEGERLTNLINDVLDLAKIEAGKMEWNMESVNMVEVVERAIASTSSLFDQKNLHLERKITPGLTEITGDRDKLIQVVVNLLSNAVKFTNAGTVTCSVSQNAEGIVVGITDTGIGIAPEDHDKVFEQFKQVGDTLTDKPKGTGLGLPICKEIVEHHGGKIWLDSDLGKGSTFYFMLPVVGVQDKGQKPIQLNELLQQLKTRVAESHPSIKNANATILVVDDDDGIRSLLKQELGDAGYQLEEASNGKEALAKVREVKPNLIILDVMMPEMNGFDVAAVLKNDPQTMDIPIIILSIVQDKSRGFRIGVDRYLTKPIDTGLLFSEIGHLLDQGKSKKRVMVVDEDSVIVRTLAEVLQAKGYQVVESDGKELVEKAISTQPDIIILNSLISDKQEIVKSLRFEKGLENVLFLIYQ
jgi:signal transduction histidine kinase/CheY-like chemotaxis protein/ligand-binding sensor domain-containing protein